MADESASRSDRGFPILLGVAGSCRDKVFVPWAMVEAHAKQADCNHGQTVQRLAERGGLAPCELVAVLEDRRWHSMDDPKAWAAIWRHVAAFLSERQPICGGCKQPMVAEWHCYDCGGPTSV